MKSRLDHLTPGQRELVDDWLPGLAVVHDHSWGLVGTTVLEVLHKDHRYIVKAGDENDGHIAREIRAHHEWSAVWSNVGRAPLATHFNADAKLIVTRYLLGQLVQGTDDEWAVGTYRQAGALLATFHQQLAITSTDFEAEQQHKTLQWLSKPHRIDGDTAQGLRDLVDSWPTPPSTLAPTHGDWQPRNWLMDDGVVSVIDFGRADLRPAMTDFARLAAQQFQTRPDLEAAFLAGYGNDPREPDAWQRNRIREAIGTAVWAYRVGDEAFEQQGHRMIADALADERSAWRLGVRRPAPH